MIVQITLKEGKFINRLNTASMKILGDRLRSWDEVIRRPASISIAYMDKCYIADTLIIIAYMVKCYIADTLIVILSLTWSNVI